MTLNDLLEECMALKTVAERGLVASVKFEMGTEVVTALLRTSEPERTAKRNAIIAGIREAVINSKPNGESHPEHQLICAAITRAANTLKPFASAQHPWKRLLPYLCAAYPQLIGSEIPVELFNNWPIKANERAIAQETGIGLRQTYARIQAVAVVNWNMRLAREIANVSCPQPYDSQNMPKRGDHLLLVRPEYRAFPKYAVPLSWHVAHVLESKRTRYGVEILVSAYSQGDHTGNLGSPEQGRFSFPIECLAANFGRIDG